MDLPFTLVLNKTGTLTEQVAEGFAKAIRLGRYKTGDVIPSTRNLALALGVSRIVTRGAIRLLTDWGYISPRPGLGCVVAMNKTRFWKGNVLFVVKNFAGSFYTNVIADVLRRSLSDAGYLFSQVVVEAGSQWRYDVPGEYDFSSLEMALTQSVDLVVLMADSSEIAAQLAKRGIPFVVIGEQHYRQKSFAGLVKFDRSGAVGEFVEDCRTKGVRSVLQVGVEKEAADAVPALKRAGIAAQRLMVPVDQRYFWLEGAQRAAMDLVFARLREPRKRPDLVFFNDDFVAVGGLQAIAALGLSIPQDIRVVTWANLGIGPVYRQPLTRMEMDPYRHGETVAACVLAVLNGRKIPADASLRPNYERGKTF